MIIIIKLIDNTNFSLEVEENFTIMHIKEEIQIKKNINKYMQRLIFKGSPLSDELTLKELDIKNNSIVHLILQLMYS